MFTSKVSSKGQVTIPAEVRERLGIQEGDTLSYEMGEAGKVIVTKLRPFDAQWHRALNSTLATEWNSQEDDEAFADLQDPRRVRKAKP